jgi:hypothetical protein
LSNVLYSIDYDYTVRVVSPMTYHQAVVVFSIASSSCRFQTTVRQLVAHRPWVHHFTAGFSPSADLGSQAIAVSVSVPPPRHAYKLLYAKHYAVTLAPGQTVTEPSTPLCPNPLFGS